MKLKELRDAILDEFTKQTDKRHECSPEGLVMRYRRKPEYVDAVLLTQEAVHTHVLDRTPLPDGCRCTYATAHPPTRAHDPHHPANRRSERHRGYDHGRADPSPGSRHQHQLRHRVPSSMARTLAWRIEGSIPALQKRRPRALRRSMECPHDGQVMSHHRKPAAIYTALSLSVDCPDCGESLPSPNDSLFWTVDELSLAIEREPHRTCGACDLAFELRQQSKAQLHIELNKVTGRAP